MVYVPEGRVLYIRFKLLYYSTREWAMIMSNKSWSVSSRPKIYPGY